MDYPTEWLQAKDKWKLENVSYNEFGALIFAAASQESSTFTLFDMLNLHILVALVI
jgi:hypothetical protein